MSGHVFAVQLQDILAHHGFTVHTTLLGTSFCCDDVNRGLEDELRHAFGGNSYHSLTDLAGFCFGEAAAVANASGNCILVYGLHIGCDWNGTWGKVNHRGHEGGGRRQADAPTSILDAQQTWVQKEVLKLAARLADADDPVLELARRTGIVRRLQG